MPAPSAPSRTATFIVAVVVMALAAVGVGAAQTGLELTNPVTGIGDTTLGVGTSGLGFGWMFSTGYGDPFGFTTPSGAWGIVEGTGSLGAVDILTGAHMTADVTHAGGSGTGTVASLMAADALAFDALALADRARLQAEAKRADRQRQGLSVERQGNVGYPEEWEVTNFTACGNPNNVNYEARIEVVEAFGVMCADAEAEGVSLTINSAFRTLSHQQRLFDGAVAKYGSASAASKWVAQPKNGTCTSKHCAGIAIDVQNSGGAHAWFGQKVGCLTSDGTYLATPGGCSSSGTTIERSQLYGFIRPMDYEPWHIELGIPIAADKTVAGDCNPPGSLGVPATIAAVFRCRLTESEIPASEHAEIVAQALVVSKCESNWDTDAVVFGGKYVDTAHPETGYRYTATGVFQFTKATANGWISGGWSNAKDPVANIDGAARLYIANRERGADGWASWACAMVNDGFAKSSVLPGYPGGPSDYPSWAWAY